MTMEQLERQLENTHIISAPTGNEKQSHSAVLSDVLHMFDSRRQGKPDVVFICIDCEAYERDQAKVTEIGVAVLDMRDLWSIEPFRLAELDPGFIKSAHCRPVEFSKLVNRRFVHGCPKAFGFGTSSWVRTIDVAPIPQRIFEDPSRISVAAHSSDITSEPLRDVVVVGHGLGNDDKYLRTLGFSFRSAPNVIGVTDTQRLASTGTQVSLKKLLAALQIEAVNLYNAGNDAVYTMQALVKMAALESDEPGRLAELLCMVKGKRLEKYDDTIVAPTVWGGTAVVGDKRSFVRKRNYGLGKGRALRKPVDKTQGSR
jgi:hypothetical protein